MKFWNWLTRRRTDHGWPGYIINGRIRTSTAALILAFFVISWLHNTYQPAPEPVAVPETAQVVPPGFMPDPEYTWVPRTNVEPRTTYRTTTTPTTTTPTTTTTTETTLPETTSPTETTSGTATTGPAPTTFVDPDGPGPLPPTPVTPAPAPAPSSSILPVPNRSGTSTTTTTTVFPGQVPATTPPLPPG